LTVKPSCLLLSLCALAVPAVSTFAQGPSTGSGQAYPAKPVRVIAPFPPGGGTDLFARAVAQKLTAALGQTFVVDNRAGAGGMIGADLIAKAPPDGYSLLITSSSTHSINPHLTRKMPYDALRDFAPVINIASAPNVLVVHPSVPARTVKELIALAKSRPGALNYGSNGTGTLSHLTGEMFKLQAGINLVHIPYKGGPPAVIDLVAGQISVLFAAAPTVFPQVRAGKLRAIASTGTQRSASAMNLPVVAETLPGFDSVQWWAMFAPAGTPAEIVERLNAEVARVITDAEVKSRFAAEGAEPAGGSPREFAAFVRADYEKWGKIVKAVGIRPE
jgi:tripartite-type tricarboxylate transporter receptor subunit TctC